MSRTIMVWDAIEKRPKKRVVAARVLGVWALHPDIGSGISGWTVTHWPSGARIPGWRNRREAAQLQAALAWHWRGWARHDETGRPSTAPPALNETVQRSWA